MMLILKRFLLQSIKLNQDKPLPEPKEEKATVEGKLAKIKDLHEKGMITDEEYASKRKDIIDKL